MNKGGRKKVAGKRRQADKKKAGRQVVVAWEVMSGMFKMPHTVGQAWD